MYPEDLSDYPDHIILTGSFARFLILRKVSTKLWKGGYTGLPLENLDEEQLCEYTPIICARLLSFL